MRQDDPGSPFLLLQGPFNVLLGIRSSPFCCSTGSAKQALNENQWEPGAQHGPIYPASQSGSIIYSESCHALTSCRQHPGSPPYSATRAMSTLLRAAGCDGTGTETNAKVWARDANFRARLEKKSPSQCCFASLPASSVIYCHFTNTVLNVGAAQWHQ